MVLTNLKSRSNLLFMANGKNKYGTKINQMYLYYSWYKLEDRSSFSSARTGNKRPWDKIIKVAQLELISIYGILMVSLGNKKVGSN